MANSGFYRPTGFQDSMNIQPESNKNTRLVKNNIKNIYDPEELLEILYDKNSVFNNMGRDLKSIKEYLDAKKSNKYNFFMYEQSQGKNDVNASLIQNSVDITHSSDAFTISDNGRRPEIQNINYRITLRNSDNLKQEDVLAFIKTFKSEAEKRDAYVNCKILFEQSDGIVFYADKENLLETVKLLEDLKDENVYGKNVTNAIKSFGNPQPFSATLSDDSYYSIAMHGAESNNSKLKITRGGGLSRTFNGYIDDVLEMTYNKLLSKYGNDSSKITAGEFYKEMVTYHTNRMAVGEAIPLWMNNRIYNDMEYTKGKSL